MVSMKPEDRPSIYKVLESLCKMDSEGDNELYLNAIDMLMGVKLLSKDFKDGQSAVVQLEKLIEGDA